MDEVARLELDGKSYEFPIVTGSEGERAIDIRNLRSETGLSDMEVARRIAWVLAKAAREQPPL